ncbi:MAG: hypothetical protein ABI855_10650 [Bacteroidota bacterium]
MKRKELGKFKMISCVCYYFKNEKQLSEEIFMLKEAVSKLNELEKSMWVELRLVKETLSGITNEKCGWKNEIIVLSLKMTGLMKARSSDANDITMVKAVHCSFSDLNRAKDEVFVKRCELILKNSLKQKKSLYKYGLKDEMLTELQTLISKYSIKIPLYNHERSESASHHAELRKLIKEACHLLKYNIDAMMEMLKEKYAHECGTYKHIRKATCHGRKRKAYGGRFKDKLTGETLKDVQMSIVEKAEKIVVDFKNNLEATAEEFAGKVTVIIEKAGYKKMILQDVNIMQLHELAGEMEREEKEKKIEGKEEGVKF